MLDKDCLAKPLSLVKDGDLVALVQHMIRTRGRHTVRVTKVKGHANDDDVQHGRVRLLDRLGNIEADIAADLGRRHQTELLIDARRKLLQARSYWYPIMADLHRFMIAIARVSVNHDGKGGTAPDPLVWDPGSRPKVRSFAIRVTVDLASLPGPPGFLIVLGFRLLLVTLLVMILLLGLIVLVFWFDSLPFLILCTGQVVLMIWVILGFLSWNFLSFSSNGLVTVCLVKRLPDLMFGLVVLFLFPLFLLQREWKFDMGANFLAVLLGAW